QRTSRVFPIALSVLSFEITCAIRLPWKKSFKAAGSTGQSPARHVSPRENTRPIEAAKMPLPRWVSLSLAKRLRHLCSTRSSRRNIFRKSSASRNDFQTLMKKSILFLSIICASGRTMVSIYNTIIDAQSWGSDIPTSIQTARDYFQHVDPRRFFTVAGPVNLILIVLTLILFWKDSVKIRVYFAT